MKKSSLCSYREEKKGCECSSHAVFLAPLQGWALQDLHRRGPSWELTPKWGTAAVCLAVGTRGQRQRRSPAALHSLPFLLSSTTAVQKGAWAPPCGSDALL